MVGSWIRGSGHRLTQPRVGIIVNNIALDVAK
jgi:hypothetical protein